MSSFSCYLKHLIGFIFHCLYVSRFVSISDWSGANDHERVQRQLSVSSDSKLLDDDIREEARVIMRPKKPPRPKSEVFLNKQDLHPRRKRFSAFGVSKLMLMFYFGFHELTSSRIHLFFSSTFVFSLWV